MTPQPTAHPAASASPAQQYSRPPTFPQMSTVGSYQNSATHTPAPSQPTPYGGPQQVQQPTYAHGYGATPAPAYNRNTIQQHQAQTYQQSQTNQVQERRAPEAYVLSDTANSSIPEEIRNQFPQDDQGRILFFTRPPIDTRHMISGRTAADKGKPLVHTAQYLEAKEAREKTLSETKRPANDLNGDAVQGHGHKRVKHGHFGEERDSDGRIRINQAAFAENGVDLTQKPTIESEEAAQLQVQALKMLSDGMSKGTAEDYLRNYGKNALKIFSEDRMRVTARVQDEEQREFMLPETNSGGDIAADTRKMLGQNFWTGRYADGSGRFEDDFDNRLPR